MYVFLIVLFVIASILMCLIVLIQNSKGGGLASSFSSSNQIMGVRKTTDFLEKTTWGLAIFMVVLSIATAYVVKSTPQGNTSAIEQKAVQERNQNPISAPDVQPSQSPPESGAQSSAPAEQSQPAE